MLNDILENKPSLIYEGYFNSVDNDINPDDYNQIGNNGGFYVWCFSFEPLVSSREDRLFVNEIPWNKVFLRLKQITSNFSFIEGDVEVSVNIHCGKYSRDFGDKQLSYNMIDEFIVSVLDSQVDNVPNHQIDLQAIYAIKFACSGIEDINGFKRDLVRLKQWIKIAFDYYDSIDSHNRSVTCSFSNILQYCSGNEEDMSSWKEVLSRYHKNMPSRYIGKLYDVLMQNGSWSEDDSDPEPSETGRNIGNTTLDKDHSYDYPGYCKKLVRFLKNENGMLTSDERLVWNGIKMKNNTLSRDEDKQEEHLKFVFYIDTDNHLDGKETANMIYDKCFSNMNIKQKLELSMHGKRDITVIDIFVITDLPVKCDELWYVYDDLHINKDHCKILFRITFVNTKRIPWFNNFNNSKYTIKDLENISSMMSDNDIYKVKNNEIDYPF